MRADTGPGERGSVGSHRSRVGGEAVVTWYVGDAVIKGVY